MKRNEINKIIRKMTLKEKIGQLQMIEIHRLMEEPWDENKAEEDWNYIRNELNEEALSKILIDYGVGFIFYGGTGILKNNTFEGWQSVCKLLKKYTDKTRLKIPVLQGLDAIHGFNYLSNNVIYSHNLGVMATWDESNAYILAKETQNELRYAGMDSVYAPNCDISRDPRWSRVYESCGEDPYLASKMIEMYVKGYQENSKFAACAKHFLAYGESSTGKDREPIDISERTIREIHVPSFKAAINSGVKMIMLNSSSLNGIPVHKNKWLINNLLRKELGFKGLVVSDWADLQKIYNVHKTMNSFEDGIISAINAGVDLNMVPDNLAVIDIITKAVEDKKIPIERINESVERVLALKLELGLFEEELKWKNIKVDRYEAQKNAYHIASESAVLLKNNNILPIKKENKKVLIVGEPANTRRHLCGGWTVGWNIIEEDNITAGDTIFTSFKKNLKSKNSITYVKDKNELKQLEDTYDISIIVIAEDPYAEDECDNPELKLPNEQIELLRKLSERNEKVVCVLISGRPVLLNEVIELSDALLWSCYPGTEGGKAIFDILFGNVNPSGKLPVSFPRSLGDLPVLYNCRNRTTYNPMFPFGFGLSYTQFQYKNIILPKQVKENENMIISLDVENTGEYGGKDVIQIYGSHLYFSCIGLSKELMGFKKVYVDKHQVCHVDIVIDKEKIKTLNENNRWIYEKHILNIEIGGKVFSVQICK